MDCKNGTNDIKQYIEIQSRLYSSMRHMRLIDKVKTETAQRGRSKTQQTQWSSQERAGVRGEREREREGEIAWQMWAALAVAQCKALLQHRNPAGPEQVVRVPITEPADRWQRGKMRKVARWAEEKERKRQRGFSNSSRSDIHEYSHTGHCCATYAVISSKSTF